LTDYYTKKIIYIEDIPANVKLVKQILNSRQEIKLLSAQTAQDGIELAQVETPDLILMDIHLPGMDGLTAFKKLQTINETKNIPIIALTADAMDGDIKKALNLGFKSYITKPIDVPSFLNTIDKILK
jgi:CheY-like chemotaxis protein